MLTRFLTSTPQFHTYGLILSLMKENPDTPRPLLVVAAQRSMTCSSDCMRMYMEKTLARDETNLTQIYLHTSRLALEWHD
jgi:hypothetical protein